MADFLTNLVGRATGQTPKLRPVVPPLFSGGEEPPEPAAGREAPLFAAGVAEENRPAERVARGDAGAPGPFAAVATDSRADPEAEPPATSEARRAEPKPGQPARAPEHDAVQEAAGPRPQDSQPRRRAWSTVRATYARGLEAEDEPETGKPLLRRPQRRDARAGVRAEAQPPESDDGALLMPPERPPSGAWEGPDDPARPRWASEGRPARRASPVAGTVSDRQEAAGPTIEVTIGRVEVRAVRPPEARPREQKPAPSKRPAAPMSLEEYLRKERRGGRP